MNRAAVPIPEKLFFKIGEVCEITGVQAHVLRYWESEFPMLAPQKNRAGQRTYRKRDVEMALRIKELLYEDQYTIAGAKKKLASDIRGASKLKVVTPDMTASSVAANQTELADIGAASPAQSVIAHPVSDDDYGFDEPPQSPRATSTSDERQLAIRRLREQMKELLAMMDANEEVTGPRRR